MKTKDWRHYGRFQAYLQRSVLKSIIALALAGVTLFIIGFVSLTYIDNRTNCKNNLDELKSVYLQLYKQNEDFLQDENINEICAGIFQGGNNNTALRNRFRSEFRKFNAACSVKNKAILSGLDGRIVYSSYMSEELSSYLVNYNAAICYNARNSGIDGIYNAVYYDSGNYSDYIFVKPILHEGSLVGFLSLYLSGNDWNYKLSNYNYDGVITDSRKNVLYSSKSKFVGSVNKFYGMDRGILELGDDRYFIMGEELPEYNVKIYSMIYSSDSPIFYIGLIVVFVMGILWYKLAKGMSLSMAENNAQRIELLLKEIRIIRQGNAAYRINMDQEDEFTEVGDSINLMLDNINELNERNTQLIRLNNKMEIDQLTAQINPHFLYNTLEIIRNLVLIDGKMAEELIIQLTRLLRYGISSSSGDVRLKEDMLYLDKYIYIQKCRFGGRFRCSVDISEDCLPCRVPKLALQPIIENSIKYGFKTKTEIEVEIKGRMEGGALVLSVKDNGGGMKESDAAELIKSLNSYEAFSESYGLYNIHRRLYLEHGEKSGITIINEESKGFQVIMRVSQEG